jgi:hypothetical protein
MACGGANAARRHQALIASRFAGHHGSDGCPRFPADLWERGWRVSHNTVATLMAEPRLVARRNRRRRARTKADRSARNAPGCAAAERHPTTAAQPALVWGS